MEVKLDRILGRHVVGRDGKRVGRLEEFRAHKEGQGWAIAEFLIGAAGAWERLGLGARLIIGRGPGGYLARWEQLDFGQDGPVRLRCHVSELRRL